MDGPLELKQVGERLVLKGRAFDFVELTLRDEEGKEHRRQVVKHPGSVVILPILEGVAEETKQKKAEPLTPALSPEGRGRGARIVMIRNSRYALGCKLDELPAGTCEAGEAPEKTAAREVREETGYEAATLEYLGRFHTTPGMTDELMHAYVARGLTHVGQDLDEGEHVSVREWTAEDALAAVDVGRITDAKTILVLLWARSRGIL
ncbi:MAG: NUDIX hydrolase [Phycisphaerales bacterium]